MSENGQQPRVFISHSSKDKDFVRRLARDLSEKNTEVWIDDQELDVGDSIVQGISSALRNTDYFILVVSTNSAQSNWVRQELNSALMNELSGAGAVVLPVRIDDAPLPQLLIDRIYADFRSDYNRGLIALLSVFSQETTSIGAEAGSSTLGGASCKSILTSITRADLRRRLDRKLSFDELKVLWYSTFETVLDDQLPNQPKSICAIEIIERAGRRGAMNELLDNICEDYGFVADNL